MSLIPHRKKLLDSLSHFPFSWEEFSNFSPGLWHDMLEESNLYGLSAYEDKDNNLIIEAEVPGFKKDEINIDLNNGVLWITAEKKEDAQDKERKYIRQKVNIRSYRYTLPKDIDDKDEPKATFKDGIVQISFHKSKKSEAKKIVIKEKTD